MPTVKQIFEMMPAKFRPSALSGEKSFYFSIGDNKYTVELGPDGCTVSKGKTRDNCDVVLKTTDKIFVNLVTKGKAPGPIDIARGKFKTNDVAGLTALKDLFDF